MSSPDEVGQRRGTKRGRGRASLEDDAAGKKARGRPRVDTQDATAADRRRTQIRLAQRAYRQRKETTIASLQEKNARLQAIITQMNKLVTEFDTAAAKSSVLQLDTNLTTHLKQITGHFAALVKSASENSVDGDDDMAESMIDATTNGQDAPESRSQEQQHVLPAQPNSENRMDIGWGYSTEMADAVPRSGNWESTQAVHRSDKEFSKAPTAPNAPMYGDNNYTSRVLRPPVRVGQVMDQAISWNSVQAPERGESNELPFGMVDVRQQEYSSRTQSSQAITAAILTPETTPPSKRLPSPPTLNILSTKPVRTACTYSHDETTFARRLSRAAFEAGYQLLSIAPQRPATINRVFRLWVPHKSVDELLEGFKGLLSRGIHEDLDSWESPFLHLGGAGTHYPPKDAQGTIISKPNNWKIRRVGPISSNTVLVENISDPSKNHEMKIDLTGFEGEWFDPVDVEGYLEQEKGCRIDPKQSFAEVLVDEDYINTPGSPGEEFGAFMGLHGKTFHPYDTGKWPPPPPPPAPTSASHPGQAASTQSTSHGNMPAQNAANASNTSNLFTQPDAPFGMDMNMGIDMNSNLPSLDFNLFDEAIGLDLAPGFAMNTQNQVPPHNFPPLNFDSNVDMGPLGLDLMGAGHGNSSNGEPLEARQNIKKKKVAWVDVTKLVDEMILHAVCLGRSPGFRRKDVDRAFRKCLISAF
ncbi:unnamed protein product [Periconia digitata]|uniref:BZIP domain-containing protein n=1 Tax=Periconia digitata TaxID=1303443 RepID=A0A9W4URN1_9PLEO|nr:unnamed protein product [Periconia digitata]